MYLPQETLPTVFVAVWADTENPFATRSPVVVGVFTNKHDALVALAESIRDCLTDDSGNWCYPSENGDAPLIFPESFADVPWTGLERWLCDVDDAFGRFFYSEVYEATVQTQHNPLPPTTIEYWKEV